jgi:hypothetical protein
MVLKNVQENDVGLKLNRIHQLLAYADDVIVIVYLFHRFKPNSAIGCRTCHVNLLGDNIDTINRNTN